MGRVIGCNLRHAIAITVMAMGPSLRSPNLGCSAFVSFSSVPTKTVTATGAERTAWSIVRSSPTADEMTGTQMSSGDDSYPEMGPDGLWKIENENQHRAFLSSNTDKIVVMKFYAPWCRACKGLEPKFLMVKNDVRYQPLPMVFSDFSVANNREYVKALGILALPTVHIYAAGELVESFPCGPSKIPVLKKKIASVVNERVDAETMELTVTSPSVTDDDTTENQEDDSNVNVSVDYLKERIPYFRKCLSNEEVSAMLQTSSVQTFEAGSVIIQQGTPGNKFYVIIDGALEIGVRSSSTYYEQDPLVQTKFFLGTVINRLYAGDYFGERALITGEPNAASIRATERTRCLVFEQELISPNSVLSGKKQVELSDQKIEQLDDKYGVDVEQLYGLAMEAPITGLAVANQKRGSTNVQSIPNFDADDDVDDLLTYPEEVDSSQQPLEQEPQQLSALTRKEVIQRLMRFKNIRRAARCFEYVAKTEPIKWGDEGEQKRRSLLVSMLTPNQIADYRAAFEVIDKSHDEMVSLQEMRDFMETARIQGEKPTDQELQRMIDRAHINDDNDVRKILPNGNPNFNHNPQITYQEFLGVMAEAEFYQLFKETFEALDTYQSGFVTARDLDYLLDGMRDLISDNRKSIIDQTVEDMDMLIDYEKFSKMLLGIAL